jgi:glucose 1-dehydrogenase
LENYYSEQGLIKPHLPKTPIQRILEGQTALVTGAGSGIGQAVAIALGAAGANVVVNYVTHPEQAEATAVAIRAAGAKALCIQADVSKEEPIQAMFQAAVTEFGRLDIMINNAGIQVDAPFHEMTLAQWQKVIDVNLTGQFLCSREAVRLFKKQGVNPAISCAAGKIVCISSVHEVIPWAGHVNYATSKGGILMMMKSLSQEVAQDRIRVNSIGPGAIRTPINTQAWETQDAYNALMKLIPYKRIGEPEEIGRAAVWLCSDYSDYINGTTLFVDGGMTLYPGFETGG